jgi:hypothetical protein
MGIQIPFMATDGDVSQKPPPSRLGSRLPWRRWPVLPMLLLGLVGWFLVYYATAWGPWAFSDAAGYITAARNLVAGHGIGSFKPNGEFSPTTSHPPLYVLAIGLVSQLGIEPLEAARVTDIILFGLLVSAGGLMVSRLLNSPWPGAAFSALVLLHPALIIAYTSAMAEPPFILLGFLSLLLVTMYSRGHRTRALLGASLCAGGALLSRYPGAAFVLTGAISVLIWGGPGRAVRLRRAMAFAAVGGTPVGIFVLWATSMPGAEGPRALSERLEILPGLVRFGQSVGAAVWSWKPFPPAVLLPDWLNAMAPSGLLRGGLAAAIALALGWLGFQTLRRLRGEPELRLKSQPALQLLLVLALFLGIYLGFFAAAYLVTNPTPDVDSRTMLPLLPALLAIAVVFAHITLRAWRDTRPLRLGWSAILLVALAGYGIISQDIVLGLHRTGLGYTSREWRQSETIAAVRQLPSSIQLISNEPYAVLLLIGRNPYPIAEIQQRQPAETFVPFGLGSSTSERLFQEGKAALVIFDTIHAELQQLYGDQAELRYANLLEGLYPSFVGSDGGIYWREAP